MADYRKQFDPHDDSCKDDLDSEFLEQLLQSGYAAPEISAEFQRGLLRRLDQEYAADFLSSQPSFAGPSFAGNDALDRSATSPARPRRRIGLRMAMTMAAAASLLFAVSLWSSQSAYGWAAMMRALENCGWVQATSDSTNLRGWVSAKRGIVAVRSAKQVAFHDHREQVASYYSTDRKVISQQSLAPAEVMSGAAGLLGLILQDGAGHQQPVLPDFEVVTESWRRIPANEDQAELIELRVTFELLGLEGRLAKLTFLIDPKTQLPLSCQLLAEGQGAAKSIEFSYPGEGPESIYALNIPRETEVVVMLDQEEVLRSKAAREAEARRSLTRKNDSEFVGSEAAGNQVGATFAVEKVAAEEAIGTVGKDTGDQPAAGLLDTTGLLDAEQTESRIASNPDPLAQAAQAQAVAAQVTPSQVMPAPALPQRPMAPQELVKKIDEQMAANWRAGRVTPADPASDVEFMRRVYLDLTGRIPAHHEVYDFLAAASENRREQLVDQLLASRDHATHLAAVWRRILLPEGVDASSYGGTAKFDEWLADRFEKNLPYDELVQQLLLAEGRVSDSGPILFYAALRLNPEELAAKTARTFLGMRMECAQCHDHKFDDSITQEDFWGFAAHFAQISRPRGKIEMTSSVLRVRDQGRGEVMFPETEDVVMPRLPYALESNTPASNKAAGEGHALEGGAEGGTERSRRKVLVDWLTTKQNSRFSRATVNRAWQHLFGLGLVEPVDDMRDDNPAIYPEVLQTLSLDFAASGYDLRRLLRTLVMSEAYQLSSRSAADEPSQGLAFARMNIKSFTADQLYDCISVATESEAMQGGNPAEGSLVRFGNGTRQAFIEQFRAPPGQRTDFHAGIPQALTLMHGRLIHGATDLRSSGLLKGLKAPFFTDEQRVETLFLSTLSRFPGDAERAKMVEYVQAATGEEERLRALGDILWALLNSAEFTFIH